MGVGADDDLRAARRAVLERQALLPARHAEDFFHNHFHHYRTFLLFGREFLYQIVEFAEHIARHREVFDEKVEFVAVKTEKPVLAQGECVFVSDFYAQVFRQDVEFASVIAADEKNGVFQADFAQGFEDFEIFFGQFVRVVAIEKVAVYDERVKAAFFEDGEDFVSAAYARAEV